jgi:hypothetical protein
LIAGKGGGRSKQGDRYYDDEPFHNRFRSLSGCRNAIGEIGREK